MTGLNLAAELVRRVHHWIDLASQYPVRLGKDIHNLAECHVADDEQVNVAVALEFVPGGRTKNERNANALGEGGQSPADHAYSSRGLHEQGLQFAENW